ncbi:MAG: metallophosphoesterase family protein [Gemmataceae bacterium]|nr:metallophosphoesterase family protein [Gemmataceae bacterium]
MNGAITFIFFSALVPAQTGITEIKDVLLKPKPRLTPAEFHKPGPYPDRIILTFAGDPSTTQAVTWRTDTKTAESFVEVSPIDSSAAFSGYGKVVGKKTIRKVAAKKEILKTDLGEAAYHSALIDSLQPGRKYLYRVGEGAHFSEWQEFKAAASGPEPFRFVYFGDAQNALRDHWSRVIRRAFADAPDARFLLHAGDLINSANSDAEWGEWFAAGGWANGMVPSIPVAGNHEWYDTAAVKAAAITPDKEAKKDPSQPKTKEDLEKEKKEKELAAARYRGGISRHWRPQFTLPQNGPPGQEELTYYLDYQGVRLVVLNSNEPRRGSVHQGKLDQAQWLEKVLGENPNPWTIVCFHHPVYSTAGTRDNPELRKIWKPVFDKYKVDLVLQGHDHSYGRSGMAGPGTAREVERLSVNGTVYVVSVSGPKMYTLNKLPWMASSAQDTQLYQIIQVDGKTLRYEARTAAGNLYDRFEIRKDARGDRRLVEGSVLTSELQQQQVPSGQSWLAVSLIGLAALLVFLPRLRNCRS